MDDTLKMGYRVCDVMTRKPIAVTPDTVIKRCAAIMRDKDIGSLVVKDGEELIGYITERALVHKFLAKNLPPSAKASEVMFDKLITITPDQDLSEALLKMRIHKIRQLPVIDELNNNKLVGILTMNDIINVQPQLFEILLEKMKAEDIRARYPLEGTCDSCNEYFDKLFEVNDDFLCSKCRSQDI